MADGRHVGFYSKIIGSKPRIISVSLLAVIFIGLADYQTGTEISLAIFYLLPIAFVTWFASRNDGLLVSVFATTVSFVSDVVFAGQYYFHAAIPYWNGVMRCGVSIILVLLVSRLKVALLHEKETSRIKSEMLSLVGHFNMMMTSALDMRSIGKSLLETVEIFFPGSSTTMRLLNRESGYLEPLTSSNLDEHEWKNEGQIRLTYPEIRELKAPGIVRNVQDDTHTWDTEFCRRNGFASYAEFPLFTAGDLLGIISIYTKAEHEFTKEEVSFLTALAGQAAIVLQNAQLFKEVHFGHAQLRELSHRLLDNQEIDRRHIAKELHDEIGQILTGLNLTLEMTARLPPEQVGMRLADAQALLNDLIRRIRGISLELRPSMLDDLGLLATLLWHIDRYTSTTGVKVTFNQRGLEGQRFESQIETAAYRIVQEALTNVARHAKVSQASVYVWYMRDILIIEIRDQGAGFDAASALKAGKSIGLNGMRERAILLGGELSIESTPGCGTYLTAQLPTAQPDVKTM